MSWKEIAPGENYFLSSILSHMSAPHDCSKRYRMNVYKTDLAKQTAGTLHNDPRLSPSYLALHACLPSLPTNHIPALKVGWNATFSFPLLSLSVQTAKKGGQLGWWFPDVGTCPPGLEEGLPTPSRSARLKSTEQPSPQGWSVLLRLSQHYPFGCLRSWGGRETSWRLVPRAVLPSQAGN